MKVIVDTVDAKLSQDIVIVEFTVNNGVDELIRTVEWLTSSGCEIIE